MKLSSPFLKLPYSFDACRILKELSGPWVEHFMFAKEGNDGVLLVTTNGDQNNLHDEPMLPTPALDAMPYTKSIWSELDIPFMRSRFMRIRAGGQMPEHTDVHPWWDDKARVHIPVQTNNLVKFSCGGESVFMKIGECWAIDNSLPHSIENGGDSDRIHLVIDVPLSWLN